MNICCEVCDQRRPCVDVVYSENGLSEPIPVCHECRGLKTCQACTDEYQRRINDEQFDARGNPR